MNAFEQKNLNIIELLTFIKVKNILKNSIFETLEAKVDEYI